MDSLLLKEDHDDLKTRILTKLQLGQFFHVSDVECARYYLHLAIAEHEASGFEKSIGIGHYYLAMINDNLGQYEKAIQNYKIALDDFKKYKKNKESGRATLQIAHCYKKLGDHQQSLNYYQKAIEIGESIQNSSILFDSYSQIGGLYNSLYEDELALANYKKSIPFAEKIGFHKVVYGKTNIIYSLVRLEEFDEAECIGSELMEFLNKDLYFQEKIVFFMYMGLLYKKQERFELAEKYLKQAVQLSEDNSDLNLTNINSIYLNYAATLQVAGKEEKAYPYFKKVNTFAQKSENKQLLLESHVGLSNYYEYIGNYKRAYEELSEHSKLEKEFRGDKIKKEIGKSTVKNMLEKKENKIDDLKTEKEQMSQLLEKQTLAILGIGLMFLALLSVFTAFYQRNKRREAEMNVAVSHNQLAILRSNMNPHFIFNSINAIQNFILKSEKFEAYEYMTKFANLTRNILKVSKSLTISLEDEIKIIENYVDLEKIRFRDKFEYSIVNNINEEDRSCFIPSMVIQPIIENAIIHGLSNLHSAGKLLIEIQSNPNGIECLVTDNGIGRKKAMENKKKNSHQHLSIATKNTEKRIQILKKLGFEKVSVKIKDLYDPNKEATGTRVQVILPFVPNHWNETTNHKLTKNEKETKHSHR